MDPYEVHIKLALSHYVSVPFIRACTAGPECSLDHPWWLYWMELVRAPHKDHDGHEAYDLVRMKRN